MWRISEMKQRAWSWVRYLYGAAYAVCLIPFLLQAFGDNEINPLFAAASEKTIAHHLDALPFVQQLFLLFSFTAMAFFLFFISLLVRYLLLNPLEVGVCRYFLQSKRDGANAGISVLFSVFTKEGYWNLVKILFFRDLYEFLWSLLLVIPGIYKSYEYKMIPYLLAENPQMERREAFARTRELMDGNRLQGFLLELSFIGWNFLAICAASILTHAFAAVAVLVPGMLLLSALLAGVIEQLPLPYIQASWTEVYLHLQYHAFRTEETYL